MHLEKGKWQSLMRLNWLTNNFICKDMYAPFVVEKDLDYMESLKKKFALVIKRAEESGADEESLKILHRYRKNILKSLKYYYRADITKSNKIIRGLIKDIGNDPLAIDTINQSCAFPGVAGEEIQFFRCRIGNPSNEYTAKDMLHLPLSLRAKSGNYRFSIPGNPSLYLANSSYGCWIETGFPNENEFNVSPVILDGTQKILNLAVSCRNFWKLNEFEEKRVHCWLKLYMLMIATSYIVKEEGRTFKSEYIISQAIMMACKKIGLDGVAYYSKRVNDEIFSFCAINLVLFVNYEGQYSDIVRCMKMDDAFNYGLYRKLNDSLKNKEFKLRSIQAGIITNIGNYDRQYPYKETEFYKFDKFLFASWKDKPNGKGKDKIPWGVPID